MRIRHLLVALASLTILAAPVGLGTHAAAAVPVRLPIYVVNVADSGPGSLRAAIDRANTKVGADTILFAVPGPGPHVVTPLADLPPITGPVTIDGYVQAGSSLATDTSPATIQVVIDGQNLSVGLDLQSDGSHVRGLAIHSLASTSGPVPAIRIAGDGNRVTGNHLGTDATGSTPLLNDQGVEITGRENEVGGAAAASRNVIGANYDGVIVLGGGGNEIVGNRIGTDATGTAGLGAGIGFVIAYGVMIEESDGNVVRDNLISDMFVGVEVWGDANTLQGNLIGTDAGGSVAIPNGLGVNIEGGDDNQLGGTGHGEGNVISGNDFGGVQLEAGLDGPAERNVLEGNLIGTDATGTAAIPNGTVMDLPGVSIVGAHDNTIGGGSVGAGNVISGNVGDGVSITFGSEGNSVIGNKIGVGLDGSSGLGNGASGVHIDGAADNRIGSTETSEAINIIAGNGSDGVTIEDGDRTGVIRNSISDNGGLAIDLDDDGITPNDGAPDADLGANGRQNHPDITLVDPAGTVHWSLATEPETVVRVDFYASLDCDLLGRGDASIHVGSTVVTTDRAGLVSKASTLVRLPPGTSSVIATASADRGSGVLETSELSPCDASLKA